MKKNYSLSVFKMYMSVFTLAVLITTNTAAIASDSFWPRRINGSGQIVSQTRELPWFNTISVSSAINVFITQGEYFEVKVKADDNLIEYIKTEVRKDELVIGMTTNINTGRSSTTEVHITAPAFLSVKASGASNVSSRGIIRQENIQIRGSGAADIRLNLDAAFMELKCSGASDARIEGFVQSAQVELSGASDFKSGDFLCDVLDVRLSGASSMRIGVVEAATGRLSGASDLHVKGNPRMDIRTSGASSVRNVR